MTPAERAKPELIKASRKRRIAAGSGVPVQEVNRLLAQFDQMQGMMKQMKKGGMAKMMRAMGGLKGLGRFGMKQAFARRRNGRTLRLAKSSQSGDQCRDQPGGAGAPSGYSGCCAGIQAAGGMRSTWPG